MVRNVLTGQVQAASLPIQKGLSGVSHYFYLCTITHKYFIMNGHSGLLELGAGRLKKEYSGNLVANGFFQQRC